jgi:hypothetical protein
MNYVPFWRLWATTYGVGGWRSGQAAMAVSGFAAQSQGHSRWCHSEPFSWKSSWCWERFSELPFLMCPHHQWFLTKGWHFNFLRWEMLLSVTDKTLYFTISWLAPSRWEDFDCVWLWFSARAAVALMSGEGVSCGLGCKALSKVTRGRELQSWFWWGDLSFFF